MKYVRIELGELKTLVEDSIAYQKLRRDLNLEELVKHDIGLSFSNINEEVKEALTYYVMSMYDE